MEFEKRDVDYLVKLASDILSGKVLKKGREIPNKKAFLLYEIAEAMSGFISDGQGTYYPPKMELLRNKIKKLGTLKKEKEGESDE